jgi:hypothetical protein
MADFIAVDGKLQLVYGLDGPSHISGAQWNCINCYADVTPGWWSPGLHYSFRYIIYFEMKPLKGGQSRVLTGLTPQQWGGNLILLFYLLLIIGCLLKYKLLQTLTTLPRYTDMSVECSKQAPLTYKLETAGPGFSLAVQAVTAALTVVNGNLQHGWWTRCSIS